MALTKVNRGGLNTGISDSSDANAITIDSSENVLIGDASPQVTSKLTVSGNGSADTGTFMYDGTAGTYLDINTNAANGIISLEANARSGNYPPLTFITSGSERLRIQAGGGISFNGDTAAANALDDYEEGTFTPVFQQGLTSAGYSTQIGTYIKIGRQVICSIQLRATSGTENNSHIYVGGLPFTITNDVDHSFGAFWTYNGGFWTSSANTSFLGLRNQTNLAFYKQVDGGSIVGTNSNVAANLNADLRIVVVYRAD